MKIYIDLSSINFSNVKIEAIYEIRSYAAWDNFVDEYHKMLKQISDAIDGKPSNEIVENAIHILKQLNSKRNRFSIKGIFVLLVKLILEERGYSLEKIAEDNAINIDIDREVSMRNLKSKNKGLYDYLVLLKKVL